MSYENIARIPFLLDAEHLTEADLAERAKNPAKWAAERYNSPEQFFTAAAQRHTSRSSTQQRPALAARTTASSGPIPPSTPRLAPRRWASQSQLPTSAALDLGNSSASAPLTSFFSTVLEPSSPDMMDIDTPPPLQHSSPPQQRVAHPQQMPPLQQMPPPQQMPLPQHMPPPQYMPPPQHILPPQRMPPPQHPLPPLPQQHPPHHPLPDHQAGPHDPQDDPATMSARRYGKMRAADNCPPLRENRCSS